MGKTVAELSATLSLDELAEWQAFDQVDPIGGFRGDLQAAMIAYVTAGGKDSKITDFLVIDPNPLTDEQRQAKEQFEARQKRKVGLAKLLDTLAVHGKPLDKS